jgi:type I restriction enzyme S subunit
MAHEGQQSRIGDYFDLIGGYAFKSSDFIENGVPVIKIKNVKANRMLYEDLSYVSDSFLKTRPDKLIQRGDLLITMSGNRFDGSPDTWVGKVAQFNAESPFFLNQRVGILRPKTGVEIERRFFAYALSSQRYQNEFIAIATSSGGQANLSPSQILGANVEVPSSADQRAIAGVLGALDDKIELNRQTNETLEALAQTLFKNWFVDAAATKLPKGWRETTLGEVAENPRRGIQPDEIKSSTPYIGLEHMPRRCIALSEWGHADGLESNKFEFERGEILFGKLRPYFHKVGVAPVDGVCSTDILVVRPKSPEWFGFVLGHVSSVELVNHTNAASTGTKMPRASWNDISRFEVALPPESVAAEFTDLIRPMIDRIVANIHESRTLAELRDALLPKLLSGELRTPLIK